MTMWHVMFGFTLGLVAVVVTAIASSRSITENPEPRRRKNSGGFASKPDEPCSICLGSMSNEEMNYLTCGHAFHENCLKGLRDHRLKLCPLCRSPFTSTG